MIEQYDPGWSPNYLSNFAADLWSSRRGTCATSSERDMAAFVVNLLLTDSEAGEMLDWMRFTQGGAAI